MSYYDDVEQDHDDDDDGHIHLGNLYPPLPQPEGAPSLYAGIGDPPEWYNPGPPPVVYYDALCSIRDFLLEFMQFFCVFMFMFVYCDAFCALFGPSDYAAPRGFQRRNGPY